MTCEYIWKIKQEKIQDKGNVQHQKRKTCNMNKRHLKNIQYKMSATCKGCNMKKLQNEKSVRRDECNMKIAQYEKGVI